MFYYLRIGMVMFFEPNEGDPDSPVKPMVRGVIVTMAILSLAFGIGPSSELLIGLAEDAAVALMS